MVQRDELASLAAELEANSASFREAANKLTERVKTVEHWLSTLSGRVEAHVVLWTDEGGPMQRCLSLTRSGKEWALQVYDYDTFQERITSTQLLRDASVDEKINALAEIPNLLKAMVVRQKDLVDRTTRANKDFDALASTLKISSVKKEGA